MDFVTDSSGRHILQLSAIDEVPEFVKNASVAAEDLSSLPNSAFADTLKREFPIDTAGHTWLSYGYIKSAGIQDATLITKVKRAAELHGIADKLEKIDAWASSFSKQAAAPRQYAVQIDFGNKVRNFYPINNQDEILNSAVKLGKDQSGLPLELFAEGCRNLVKAAREHQVPMNHVPRSVVEYGTERVPVPELVQSMAEMRKQATGDDTYTAIAEAVASGAEQRASHEWAELWLNADRLNGLDKVANEIDPFQLFNSGGTIEDFERELDSWAVIAGAPVPVTKVASADATAVRKYFAGSTAERLLDIVKQAATSTGASISEAFEAFSPEVAKMFVRRVLLA
jgi:hypothetical protein